MNYNDNKALQDIVYINVKGIECAEQWKNVTGYEGLYQVSNLGRVKSVLRYVKHPNLKRKKVNEKIISSKISTRKYIKCCIYKNGIASHILAHRLVAIAFIPNPENKLEVNHINGIKHDNRVENLEWCTASENQIHAYKNKLSISTKGEKCSWSKLTQKQVLMIRRLYKINPNTNQRNIAKKLNVSFSLINIIIKRKAWRHI